VWQQQQQVLTQLTLHMMMTAGHTAAQHSRQHRGPAVSGHCRCVFGGGSCAQATAQGLLQKHCLWFENPCVLNFYRCLPSVTPKRARQAMSAHSSYLCQIQAQQTAQC
jgi:hypothetical protein